MVSEAGLEPASCLFRVKGKTLNLIKNYILLHNLSTDHFDLKKHNRKYKVITKTCPACANTFIAQKIIQEKNRHVLVHVQIDILDQGKQS